MIALQAAGRLLASLLPGHAVFHQAEVPDALAGGVFAANKAAPMFLVSNMLSAEQKEYLSKKGAKSFYVLGGTGAVSDEITYDISKACV